MLSEGWGIDANPHNNPVYLMNERPSPSAVFGISVPPSGLSGLIRRLAFRYNGNRYRHWLPLLLAGPGAGRRRRAR